MGGAGLLNLLHVATSYKAFSELPAGNAMAIFYAYPIWNIIGAWLLLGEKIPMESIPWICLAVAGMLCIAQPDAGTLLDTKNPVALICAVLSGVTESCIYFFFKIFGIQEGTFTSMFELYGGSFIWIFLALVGNNASEIDIFEFWDDNTCNHNMNVHFNDNMCLTDYNGDDFSENFHIFSLIWDNYKIEWYVDGNLKRRNTKFNTLLGQQLDCEQLNKEQSYIVDKNYPLEKVNIILNLAPQIIISPTSIDFASLATVNPSSPRSLMMVSL
jgi:hypothetical protein